MARVKVRPCCNATCCNETTSGTLVCAGSAPAVASEGLALSAVLLLLSWQLGVCNASTTAVCWALGCLPCIPAYFCCYQAGPWHSTGFTLTPTPAHLFSACPVCLPASHPANRAQVDRRAEYCQEARQPDVTEAARTGSQEASSSSSTAAPCSNADKAPQEAQTATRHQGAAVSARTMCSRMKGSGTPLLPAQGEALG